MREHLTRIRSIPARLVALLPERHPDNVSWPALYGLTVLAILTGDLAGRLDCGLAVLLALPIAVYAGLLHPIAGIVLAAGLLGGFATAPGEPPPPPAAIHRGAHLPGSSTAPELPAEPKPA